MTEIIIQSTNVTKTYDNDVKAVKGLDLQIRKGEVFGFLGPNGAGKSTSIKMISGILAPTSGVLEVLGFDATKEHKKIAQSIGYVPQDLVFYDHLTVEENLKTFAKAYEIDNIAERVDYLMKLLKIEDLKDRQARNMSGGQKRRLNLAIGLINKPKLLILDEPSAGMDPQSRNVLWNTIEDMAKGDDITIILTTHLMETADRLSDRIAIIDEGVVKVVDTPKNLKDTYGAGDVIEVKLSDDLDHEVLEDLKLQFERSFGEKNVHLPDHLIKVIATDGVDAIKTIVETITSKVGKEHIVNINMHENSLEDVFIYLTGKELRE
ncbi:MAG: ABC transporter ATP-binding protein [Candidatus Heimdallarchaeota archaeon]|nr:ABC transporter ATP-binding protein [Candidatus Heimdallarchaeota archaeon]